MAKTSFLLTASLGVLVAGCADADEARSTAVNEPATLSGSMSTPQSPTAAALAGARDGSLLTLGGRVVATAPDWFRMKTGSEELTVEMDDWDWYQEGRALKVGDEVTVTGRVDKGLWEQQKIEASSVFVRNLGVSFLANGADEEERAAALVQVGTATTSAQGFVSNVEGREFTLGSMSGPVRVDISGMKSRPTPKLGDRVYAWGNLDVDTAEGAEMMAQGLVGSRPTRRRKRRPARPSRRRTPPRQARFRTY